MAPKVTPLVVVSSRNAMMLMTRLAKKPTTITINQHKITKRAPRLRGPSLIFFAFGSSSTSGGYSALHRGRRPAGRVGTFAADVAQEIAFAPFHEGRAVMTCRGVCTR